jgi:hypothetical protein
VAAEPGSVSHATSAPFRDACTSVRRRLVTIHPHEAELAAAHARQADYRATRPRVERKLAHLLRRRHGVGAPGCAAGARGQDLKLLAGAVNLARFAAFGLGSTASGWRLQPA